MKQWYAQILVEKSSLSRDDINRIIVEGNLNNICISLLPDV